MKSLRIGLLVLAGCGLTTVAVAAIMRTGASAQAVVPAIRARALELVDDRGQVRARLNVESSGEVVFRLLDQRGTIRVKLGAAEDGSGLLLANDATEPGVHVLAKASGSSLKLVNKDGRERVIAP